MNEQSIFRFHWVIGRPVDYWLHKAEPSVHHDGEGSEEGGVLLEPQSLQK